MPLLERIEPGNADLENGELVEATPSPVPRTNILGVGMSVINMDDAIRLCDSLIRTNGQRYVCVTDVHGIIEAKSDTGFRSILNGSFMTTPDGMPLVWVGRMRGHKTMRRVYGPDFMLEMCRLSVKRGYRHFLYGGKAGVAAHLGAELTRRFPGLQVVGAYTPPFRPLNSAEEAELAALVAEAEPDFFWVGLGSPKQERFMAQYCGKLDVKLMVGVGAAFDIHTGGVKEAPMWMKSLGLQWLHRLIQEPGRLWKRYLTCVPSFIWNIGLQSLGIRKFSIET